MGKSLSKAQLAAVVAGNALEFYDFLVFGFFAVQIGQAFFPSTSPTTSLLATLATFGAGFLTRPLGGIVIGRLGDRLGRRPTMLFTFGLMGFSIAGLALTPTYAAIGIAAPALVLILRLLQGFALGGEVGPSTAFLLEAAPRQRRGLYVSLQNASQYFSVLCVGLVGLGLSSVLPPDLLSAWGWRIAMLLGAAVVPFALVLRRRLPETLEISDAPPTPVAAGTVALGLVMIASVSISTFCMNYLATYAQHTLGLPQRAAFIATVVGGSVATLGALAGGVLSDAFGRKPVMLAGAGVTILAGVPCFLAMLVWPNVLMLEAATAVFSLCIGFFPPAVLTAISEGFPAARRAGSIGFVYALAVACFGGSAQYVVTWLMARTGSPLAPAWYMTGAMVLGFIAMLATRETAPGKD